MYKWPIDRRLSFWSRYVWNTWYRSLLNRRRKRNNERYNFVAANVKCHLFYIFMPSQCTNTNQVNHILKAARYPPTSPHGMMWTVSIPLNAFTWELLYENNFFFWNYLLENKKDRKVEIKIKMNDTIYPAKPISSLSPPSSPHILFGSNGMCILLHCALYSKRIEQLCLFFDFIWFIVLRLLSLGFQLNRIASSCNWKPIEKWIRVRECKR